MTEAERKRRQRAGLARKRYFGTRPETKFTDRRDEEIARLKARVAELEGWKRWHGRKGDGMTFETMSAISKALHPDRRLDETERERGATAPGTRQRPSYGLGGASWRRWMAAQNRFIHKRL
jgi:hypothetical protein